MIFFLFFLFRQFTFQTIYFLLILIWTFLFSLILCVLNFFQIFIAQNSCRAQKKMKREDENSKRVNYEIKMFQGSRVSKYTWRSFRCVLEKILNILDVTNTFWYLMIDNTWILHFLEDFDRFFDWRFIIRFKNFL